MTRPIPTPAVSTLTKKGIAFQPGTRDAPRIITHARITVSRNPANDEVCKAEAAVNNIFGNLHAPRQQTDEEAMRIDQVSLGVIASVSTEAAPSTETVLAQMYPSMCVAYLRSVLTRLAIQLSRTTEVGPTTVIAAATGGRRRPPRSERAHEGHSTDLFDHELSEVAVSLRAASAVHAKDTPTTQSQGVQAQATVASQGSQTLLQQRISKRGQKARDSSGRFSTPSASSTMSGSTVTSKADGLGAAEEKGSGGGDLPDVPSLASLAAQLTPDKEHDQLDRQETMPLTSPMTTKMTAVPEVKPEVTDESAEETMTRTPIDEKRMDDMRQSVLTYVITTLLPQCKGQGDVTHGPRDFIDPHDEINYNDDEFEAILEFCESFSEWLTIVMTKIGALSGVVVEGSGLKAVDHHIGKVIKQCMDTDEHYRTYLDHGRYDDAMALRDCVTCFVTHPVMLYCKFAEQMQASATLALQYLTMIFSSSDNQIVLEELDNARHGRMPHECSPLTQAYGIKQDGLGALRRLILRLLSNYGTSNAGALYEQLQSIELPKKPTDYGQAAQEIVATIIKILRIEEDQQTVEKSLTILMLSWKTNIVSETVSMFHSRDLTLDDPGTVNLHHRVMTVVDYLHRDTEMAMNTVMMDATQARRHDYVDPGERQREVLAKHLYEATKFVSALKQQCARLATGPGTGSLLPGTRSSYRASLLRQAPTARRPQTRSRTMPSQVTQGEGRQRWAPVSSRTRSTRTATANLTETRPSNGKQTSDRKPKAFQECYRCGKQLSSVPVCNRHSGSRDCPGKQFDLILNQEMTNATEEHVAAQSKRLGRKCERDENGVMYDWSKSLLDNIAEYTATKGQAAANNVNGWTTASQDGRHHMNDEQGSGDNQEAAEQGDAHQTTATTVTFDDEVIGDARGEWGNDYDD